MGLFSFLTKKKEKETKEDLDKGLEKTKTSVFSKITKAIMGKSTVDDEVLDNLEEILITSDVGVETTLKIIDLFQLLGQSIHLRHESVLHGVPC